MKRKAKKKLPAVERQPSGHCGFCLLPLTALQPGGTDVRHDSGTSYGLCLAAIEARAERKI